ncbi:hypothetical protein PC121_g22442 [Phytophthora cactorum]|nr:hypothetical protein PC120_g24191 [Phytophthora cactorum]KAG3043612.1 hypothetical protein PC121_g22442 [Phytophthora cactorum]
MEKKDVNSDAKDARGEDAPATEADAGCENAPAIEPDTTSRDATTLATGAMNGDEDMFDGVDAEQERTKRKDRPESLRGKSVPGEAARDNEDGLPSKCTRTGLPSNVSSGTAIK